MDDNAPSRSTRTHYSNFLVTINTNYRPQYQDDLADVAQNLENAMYQLFTHENLKKVLSFKYGGDYSQVEDIDVEFGREVGTHSKGGRLHSHSIVRIKHYTHLRLIPGEISRIIKEQMNDQRVKNVYVNVKWFQGEQFLEDYIEKQH
jgi:hypothetical protein